MCVGTQLNVRRLSDPVCRLFERFICAKNVNFQVNRSVHTLSQYILFCFLCNWTTHNCRSLALRDVVRIIFKTCIIEMPVYPNGGFPALFLFDSIGIIQIIPRSISAYSILFPLFNRSTPNSPRRRPPRISRPSPGSDPGTDQWAGVKRRSVAQLCKKK